MPAAVRPRILRSPRGKQEEVLLKAVLIVSGLVLFGAVVVACKGSDAATNGDDGVIVTPLSPTAPPGSTTPPGSNGNGATSVPSNGSAGTPTAVSSNPLTGFAFPIAGGCLPRGDQLMPNAPRTYRNGIHEGVDIYDVDTCTPITKGTPVLAMKSGRVVRADVDYRDVTAAEVAQYLADPNTEDSLDKFRGRQVWIQHDGGIITRYAHLSGIAPGITSGTTVTQGQVVAYVGESGTPESVSNPGNQYHLHFEVRVGDSYLGKGQSPIEVRTLYQQLFASP